MPSIRFNHAGLCHRREQPGFTTYGLQVMGKGNQSFPLPTERSLHYLFATHVVPAQISWGLRIEERFNGNFFLVSIPSGTDRRKRAVFVAALEKKMGLKK